MIKFIKNFRRDEELADASDGLLSTICCDMHEGPVWVDSGREHRGSDK